MVLLASRIHATCHAPLCQLANQQVHTQPLGTAPHFFLDMIHRRRKRYAALSVPRVLLAQLHTRAPLPLSFASRALRSRLKCPAAGTSPGGLPSSEGGVYGGGPVWVRPRTFPFLSKLQGLLPCLIRHHCSNGASVFFQVAVCSLASGLGSLRKVTLKCGSGMCGGAPTHQAAPVRSCKRLNMQKAASG